ncbi:unnamed protein product [Arctogadus glacialis]
MLTGGPVCTLGDQCHAPGGRVMAGTSVPKKCWWTSVMLWDRVILVDQWSYWWTSVCAVAQCHAPVDQCHAPCDNPTQTPTQVSCWCHLTSVLLLVDSVSRQCHAVTSVMLPGGRRVTLGDQCHAPGEPLSRCGPVSRLTSVLLLVDQHCHAGGPVLTLTSVTLGPASCWGTSELNGRTRLQESRASALVVLRDLAARTRALQSTGEALG